MFGKGMGTSSLGSKHLGPSQESSCMDAPEAKGEEKQQGSSDPGVVPAGLCHTDTAHVHNTASEKVYPEKGKS